MAGIPARLAPAPVGLGERESEAYRRVKNFWLIRIERNAPPNEDTQKLNYFTTKSTKHTKKKEESELLATLRAQVV